MDSKMHYVIRHSNSDGFVWFSQTTEDPKVKMGKDRYYLRTKYGVVVDRQKVVAEVTDKSASNRVYNQRLMITKGNANRIKRNESITNLAFRG